MDFKLVGGEHEGYYGRYAAGLNDTVREKVQ